MLTFIAKDTKTQRKPNGNGGNTEHAEWKTEKIF